jgi:serine/threonine protein kinase
MSSDLLYIGSCAYIIYPPISKFIFINDIKHDDKIYDNTIGKLFINNRNAFYEEYNKYNLIINKIDPNNDFTLKLIKHSAYKLKKSHLKHININVYNNLKINNKLITDNLDIYEMIIEKGEITLHEHLKKIYYPIEIFKQLFLNILLGVKKLHENNIIHLDIKETNIILLKNKLYLIDFGISSDLYDFFEHEKIHIFKQKYVYHPFETLIFNYIYINLYTSKNITCSINDIIIFIKNNKNNIIETNIDNYYNNLNNYLFFYNISKDTIIKQINTFIDSIINIEYDNIDIKQDFIKCISNIFKIYTKKIDLFSIGITLNRLMIFIINNNKLANLIPLLLNSNPNERLDIDQLIEYFNNL